MLSNILGFSILMAISLVIAVVVFALINKHLCAILDEVVKLPACTTLYSRILLIGLLFTSAAASLDITFDLKEDTAFMEYVWKVASGLSEVFSSIFWFFVAYLVVITVIITVLRKLK